ncbi:MAG TPA: 4-alpha-glucanotransferase, partial [Kineobactrum sp.]
MNRGSHDVQPEQAIVEALGLLGKQRFSLAIHDSCFPQDSADDIGRGSPYGSGARTFFAFARGLGFDAIQLGPQGQTGRENPSPYDGTLFSRNSLNLDFGALADTLDDSGQSPGLLDRTLLDQLVAGCPDQSHSHSQHAYAYDACAIALDDIYRHFCSAREQGDPVIAGLAAGLAAFTAREKDWLEADALYHALATEHNGLHHRDWPQRGDICPDRDLYHHAANFDALCQQRRAQLQRRFAQGIERYCLSQFLLQRQHSALRGYLRRLGLRIYGDLQVGISSCDEWSRGSHYLQGYSMGAPPSRTNPAGQPWGYGVLDPEQYRDASGKPGPAMRLLLTRVGRLVQEFDGLRIDHPHGLVCPWVYASDDPDPYHAVQHGARLFSSPDLEDKPGLARYAITRPDQLNKMVPRHADDWVQWLDDAQLDRYATLVDAIVNGVLNHGGAHEDILCEVLSTLPYPLQRVITRHGLGRFRVTQKADLANPADVYRSENAAPADWIMVGNHDTPSIWRLA